MSRVVVIINAGGGSFVEGETDKAVREAFEDASLTIELSLAKPGEDPAELAKAAVEKGVETIVAGGGDGTISAVARVVADHDLTLGILPLGTLNHFARDLGIPNDLAAAAAVIADGVTRPVDICEVDGLTFINNSSIGLYPRIVRKREVQQERLGRGKWTAALFAAIQVFKTHSFLRVRLKTGTTEIVRKTPFVFVGNNEYQMDLYNIGRREKLDDGLMSVYFLRRGGRWGVVKLVLRTLFGVLRNDRDLESIKTDEISIETHKRSLLVALDGEVTAMKGPLEYRIRPRALEVIVPRPEEIDA